MNEIILKDYFKCFDEIFYNLEDMMSEESSKEYIHKYENFKFWFKSLDELIDKNYISKDKIREKIEEIEKEKTEVIHELDFKGFYTLSQLKDIEISILKRLLEE